jgi:hypothetical protein
MKAASSFNPFPPSHVSLLTFVPSLFPSPSATSPAFPPRLRPRRKRVKDSIFPLPPAQGWRNLRVWRAP